MWKEAVEREKHVEEFQKIPEESSEEGNGETEEVLKRKSNEFKKLLEVSTEERDRVQRMQVIDRAGAAIAAARSILKEESFLEMKAESDQGSLVPLNLGHELQGKTNYLKFFSFIGSFLLLAGLIFDFTTKCKKKTKQGPLPKHYYPGIVALLMI